MKERKWYRTSATERFYRSVVLPGFESVFKRRRTFARARDLEQSQWWSREKIEQLQEERLKMFIDFCFHHSPHYRDVWSNAGVQTKDVQSVFDLQKLPLTTRETMRDQSQRMRTQLAGDKFVVKSTGGSSGSPLAFTIDNNANDRRCAAAMRGYAMAGSGVGSRQLHLWGATLGDQSWLMKTKDFIYARWLYRRTMLNSFGMSEGNADDFVRQINHCRPDTIVAYTNPLDTLARIILERKMRVHRPRAILTGAEKLHDHQRHRIESAFSAPVFETYGSREFTLIGAECPAHSGLHLTSENLIVEVVNEDGRLTPDGEEGDIAVTDLWNRSTPFVRYLIGDRAVAGLSTCSCGRGLPLLRKVVGRRLDMLRTVDGRNLPGEFFPHLIKDFAAVRQFQVVQPSADEIIIKLVVNDHWNRDRAERLRRLIRDSVGSTTHLRIEEVPEIPLTAQGKRRVVISHVGNAASNGTTLMEAAR